MRGRDLRRIFNALRLSLLGAGVIGAEGASVPGSERIFLKAARHPLLEKRLRNELSAVIPIFARSKCIRAENNCSAGFGAPAATPQLIISGPNTGGKTVALKTVGLLALMAQSGIPVPAEAVELPLFDAVLADIGDAQSIEQDLSSFSAHITRLNEISNWRQPTHWCCWMNWFGNRPGRGRGAGGCDCGAFFRAARLVFDFHPSHFC